MAQLSLIRTRAELLPRRLLDGSHDWRLQVMPEGGAWRLHARLPAGRRGVLLTPSIGELESTPAAKR